ncbi:uncharacterized membrane protein HdeD (DUF308 family) [Antricoccus suffuscus]|uniref:Uncharacterized membrane protein HdeD (DUF308 family) n=1 Tax=Antricoccus suffuscus TaxID=1629062 RepID=A0A2T1A067_9ACTN|nr:HdeD family acid-resistance protein [Antricoccus suffuscus]PRZ41990.1 uncharacterized membrane protein HdeD (DUF308 family) [Antricoccus suffuscus]
MSETLIAKATSRVSWMMIIRGVLAIIFGVMVAVWPKSTVLVIVWLFGIFALIDGIIGVAHWFTDRVERSTWGIVSAVISILAGLVAIIWPGPTALAMVFLIGFWAILLGASQIALAMRAKKTMKHWYLWLICGIITVVFGLIMVFVPGAGLLSLLWLLATFTIIEGILLIVLGIFLRRVANDRARF